MKRKGFLRKALVYTVIGATIAVNAIPTFAYTNSIGNVEESQTVPTDDSAECEVYAELGSNFLVTIPKKITLSGTTKTGSYTVDVEGDIAGKEHIAVIPDESFALSSANLSSITATINQDKTDWTYDEILSDNRVFGNGLIYADGSNDSGEITAGSWNGTFNFKILFKGIGSLITVEAKNESGEDLNASASEIIGTQKDNLLDKLVDSGLVNSIDEVDALIEIESDEFDGMAETTFNVSGIANEGDKVTILHYNEETNEWEYISTETVNNDGTITSDFSSYSPVAFVKVNEDGSYSEHEHVYGTPITISATCTQNGSKTYSCYCGNTYTEDIPSTGHSWNDYYTTDIAATCTTSGKKSIRCSECYAAMSSTIIPATGHNLSAYALTYTSYSHSKYCYNCLKYFPESHNLVKTLSRTVTTYTTLSGGIQIPVIKMYYKNTCTGCNYQSAEFSG